MRKVSLWVALLLGTATLTACAYSAEEGEACTAGGGEPTGKRYNVTIQGSTKKTGMLWGCVADGKYITVYTDEVTELKNNFFGDTKRNAAIFKLCKKLEGHTYRTIYDLDDSSSPRFICLTSGEPLLELDEVKQ